MSKRPEEELLALTVIDMNAAIENFVRPIHSIYTFTESVRQAPESVHNHLVKPIFQAQEITSSVVEPIRKAQESLLGISNFTESISSIANQQAEILGLSATEFFPVKIIDADVEEESYIIQNFLSIPQPTGNIPAIELHGQNEVKRAIKTDFPSGTQYVFGMTITVEGRFLFKDRLLKKFSTSSKHGQFLEMLLKSPENYVLDQKAIPKLKIVDPDKGLGYIRDDLIKAFAQNGFDIKLYRHRKTGYRLVSVKKRSN